MRFHLVAIGTRMPDWVSAGFDDYARRLHGGARLQLHEIPAANRKGNGSDPDRARGEEAERIRRAVPSRAHVIALEVGGRSLDTESIADRLREWNREGSEVAFLVGGPDGLDPALSRSADERWSLSALTLPHALVRVVLAEQLYRALSILHNHPYHR